MRSAEVEDLRLRCVDLKAEVAMAKEQAAPLVAKIKELEEERDSLKSRPKKQRPLPRPPPSSWA